MYSSLWVHINIVNAETNSKLQYNSEIFFFYDCNDRREG